ncbi:MAG: hypothetical protein LBD11_05480 [Candidatus Peribacteria bacterium]|jgi:hypothetical protein|nr:hypothetical protein [Candidatus Peribacteria bacterium]
MAEIPQIPTSTPNVSVAPLTQPGNELNIFFNQYQFNIIKMYRKIHRFLFKNGIFVLMGIMALVIVQVLSDQTIAKSQTLSSLTSTSLTLARNAWDKQLSQQGNQDLEVLIPYGESEMREGLLSTKSNLAIYQGIVLPRVFSILSEEPFLDLEKFTNKQTTSGDLVEVIDQLIFSPLLQTSNLSFQPSLALSKGIIEDFNLQCLQEQKLSSILCDKFLATFFEDGKFYNVGAYKDDMEVLLRIIKDKDPLCRLMYDTTLYHRMIYPAFNDLILQCSTAQIQQYRELANFIEVEQELSKSFISSTIYTNKSVNAYKLLSTQQILYKNLLAGVLNKTYISSYLDYAQNLINRNNGNDRYILPLYKDILYRMNNAVLLPRLEISDNKTLSRAETQQILDKINQLNKGNPALGTIGLEKQLTTAGLVQQREI